MAGTEEGARRSTRLHTTWLGFAQGVGGEGAAAGLQLEEAEQEAHAASPVLADSPASEQPIQPGKQDSTGAGSAAQVSQRHIALDPAAAFFGTALPAEEAVGDSSDEEGADQAPRMDLLARGSELSAEALTILDTVTSSGLNRDQKDRLLRVLKSPTFSPQDIPWAIMAQLDDYLGADAVRPSRVVLCPEVLKSNGQGSLLCDALPGTWYKLRALDMVTAFCASVHCRPGQRWWC